MANQFFFGGALGVLLGLLVGLSASPVVASVVSALVGIAAGYATVSIGREEQHSARNARGEGTEGKEGDDPRGRHGHVASPVQVAAVQSYLAGFSVLATVAVLCGVSARTRGLLAPTPTEIVARWEAAGLTRAQAQQVALNVLETRLDITGDPLFVSPNSVVTAWMDAGVDPDAARGVAIQQFLMSEHRSQVIERSEESGHEKSSDEKAGAGKEGGAEAHEKADHGGGHNIGAQLGGAAPIGTGVLINEERNRCDELVSEGLTGRWSLFETNFAKGGAEWKQKLQEAQKLSTIEDRHKVLLDFAVRKCVPAPQ